MFFFIYFFFFYFFFAFFFFLLIRVTKQNTKGERRNAMHFRQREVLLFSAKECKS